MPDLLLYGTGGLGWTRIIETSSFTQSFTQTLVSFTTTATSTSPITEFGWVAGVGGETKVFGSSWLFRVEYLHYDFGNQVSSTVSNTSTVGAASTSLGNTSGRLTADVVRGALSYKFGGAKY